MSKFVRYGAGRTDRTATHLTAIAFMAEFDSFFGVDDYLTLCSPADKAKAISLFDLGTIAYTKTAENTEIGLLFKTARLDTILFE